MADFVKLSIFGTVFEVTTRLENDKYKIFRFLTPKNSRYVDLQPVGMGAFGLVW